MPGQTTRFVFYGAVLLTAVSGVLFGLDWTPAPMPPMPETKNLVFVAPPPPPPPPVVVARPPQPVVAAAPVAVEPPAPAPAPPVAAAPAPPRCDIAACAAAYRSFRESDCTYNPSVGPRRLCTKGVVPQGATDATPKDNAPKDGTPMEAGAAADEPAAVVAPEPGTQTPSDTKCNVAVCAAAYRSFRESDCTFNPSVGPRRLCEK